MKVLYVVKNMRVSNGVTSYLMNYYRNLIKRDGFNVDFLIVSDVGSPYYDEIKSNGSKIYFLPSIKHPIGMIKFLNKLFKNGKYDILHSNVFNSDFPIAFMAKINNVKVRVLHSHATSNGDSKFKIIRNKPFQYLSIKFSNYLFACSNLAGKAIYKKKKFYVVNNAIDLNKFKYDLNIRNEIRKSNNISSKKYIIATVGRLTEQKNPYFILKIIEGLAKEKINFEFWWFGSGNLDDLIKQKAKDLGILKYIKFWGSINNVYDYYSSFDMFILPSLYEGLPVVGIEAQCNGIKCLFSNKISDEVKLIDKSEFLEINDPNIWVEKIKKELAFDNHYIADETKLKENYDINKLSLQLYNLYSECLRKGEKL